MISFQDDATPICGLSQSSSPMPTARSMPRAPARSRPSVTSRLRGFIGLRPVVVMAAAYESGVSLRQRGPGLAAGHRRQDQDLGARAYDVVQPPAGRTSSPST